MPSPGGPPCIYLLSGSLPPAGTRASGPEVYPMAVQCRSKRTLLRGRCPQTDRISASFPIRSGLGISTPRGSRSDLRREQPPTTRPRPHYGCVYNILSVQMRHEWCYTMNDLLGERDNLFIPLLSIYANLTKKPASSKVPSMMVSYKASPNNVQLFLITVESIPSFDIRINLHSFVSPATPSWWFIHSGRSCKKTKTIQAPNIT